MTAVQALNHRPASHKTVILKLVIHTVGNQAHGVLVVKLVEVVQKQELLHVNAMTVQL